MDQGEGKVLEEEEAEELAHADVGPASVHQQEALEVTELGEGVVARHHGLHALLTTDPHANVCRWNPTSGKFIFTYRPTFTVLKMTVSTTTTTKKVYLLCGTFCFNL